MMGQGTLELSLMLLLLLNRLLVNSSGEAVTSSDTVVDFETGVFQCDKELKMLMDYKIHAEFLRKPSNFIDVLCRGYEKWHQCLQEVADASHTAQTRLNELIGATKHQIISTCTNKKSDLTRQLGCLSTQTGRKVNPLYRGCWRLMDMRSKSGVMDKCRTVQEYAACQDRLVRTSCGSEVADFLHALSLDVELPRLANQRKCLDTDNMPYSTGFHYSLQCPPEFPLRMGRCYDNHLQGRLRTHSEMSAVLEGGATSLDTLCSSFTAYQGCMSSLESRCPLGVSTVYSTETEWRRRVNMADYLCRDNIKPQYIRYLPCYTGLLGPSISLCSRLYNHQSTTWEVHKLACAPHSEHSMQVLRKREELIECFHSTVQKRCGTGASRVILPLLRLQYSLDLLPSCGATKPAEPRFDCSTSSATWRSKSTFERDLLSTLVMLVTWSLTVM